MLYRVFLGLAVLFRTKSTEEVEYLCIFPWLLRLAKKNFCFLVSDLISMIKQQFFCEGRAEQAYTEIKIKIKNLVHTQKDGSKSWMFGAKA